jgi:hypothetical protein
MNPFKEFNKSIMNPLRIMYAKVQSLNNMRGDGFINIQRSGAGTTIGLNLTEVKKRLARKPLNVGDFGTVARAICTQDAPGDNTITADLVLTDGTSGDDVTVTCNISNGSALNEAIPRLETDDTIYITQAVFDNVGTPVFRWECLSNFMASEDCVCEAP